MFENLSSLLNLMKSHGANRFYAKKLAPNDNAKNQVYLGGNFSALNIIPYNNLHTDSEDIAGSKRDRAKADISFYWVDENGLFKAPEAKLILYPRYPEVRMSGFLKGCRNAPSDVMNVRDEGRVLFLGITLDGNVLGFAAGADHPLARSIQTMSNLNETGVFLEVPQEPGKSNSKLQLLEKLTAIYSKGWIVSKKIGPDGLSTFYTAGNGGGYTLESELGISPNGYSEPDYLGWEVKQYGVEDFENYTPKSPITLMTPEPTGGIYKTKGVPEFLRLYGYPDKKGRSGRTNFGGNYRINSPFHPETKLQLRLTGYDSTNGKITDLKNGGIALYSQEDEIAAIWHFPGIMKHWTRKHAQAVYVPSKRNNEIQPPHYSFGNRILLCEETDFFLFLKAVSNGIVYYDPGIKMEEKSGKHSLKRRSQFRVKYSDIPFLYQKSEITFLKKKEKKDP